MAVDFAFEREVKDALRTGTLSRRSELLQSVTDLFVIGASQFDDEAIARFDDVIMRLAVDIELSARVLLAVRLAPIPNAPPNVIRSLAFDDCIDVAGPILIQSERLDDLTLVENAKKKSQQHLLAISQRKALSEVVTDVLVERGDLAVALSTVENLAAKFSKAGFEILVQRSARSDRLATGVGSRPEIPRDLFLKLLAIASDSARASLEATHPHAKAEIHRAVAEVANQIRNETSAALRSYGRAQASVHMLHQSGQLDDSRVGEFAKAGLLEETTVALAMMCDLPLPFLERVMHHEHSETVLVLAKVIGLSWSTVKAILLVQAGKRIVAADELAKSLAQFERLKPATANEIVRFYRMREQVQKDKPA
jgi:uncharacterized protein (DUF2336 family)